VTTTFATPSTFTIAPLAPAPLAGGTGAGLGHRIDVDWSSRKVDTDAATRAKRRADISKARAQVERNDPRPKAETKSERLARKVSDGSRDTASLGERRAVKSTVQRAMEQVLGLQPGTAHLVSRIPNDAEVQEPEARAVREILRQRYPGRSLSDFVKQAEAIDALLRDDPVQGRLALMRNYHQVSVENLPTFKAPQYADGLRGSLQRARQDAEDGRISARHPQNTASTLTRCSNKSRLLTARCWKARVTHRRGFQLTTAPRACLRTFRPTNLGWLPAKWRRQKRSATTTFCAASSTRFTMVISPATQKPFSRWPPS